ncbi:hypothetical protein [Acinetobacter johnsonii]|uniref:hypothetical protein n=1 Tax=Acinetobacter johnsonii TaxID=40214 RepID=UPI0021677BF4|nr:hypothetical protein [Acinetobacter johnsonii]MCS3526731.1 hypothetical protein [Acinetobacter johnsonii]
MISQDTLNLISFFAGIFTIIAAVATLIALFFAWRMWKTWKIQQTYTLHREKLIENEINIIALYHYQGNVIKQMIEIAQIECTRELTEQEINSYQQIIERIRGKEAEFEDKYGFCLFTLERYGIFYSPEVQFDLMGFKNETIQWLQRISDCENIDELNDATENYYFQSAAERDDLLMRLAQFRLTSLK